MIQPNNPGNARSSSFSSRFSLAALFVLLLAGADALAQSPAGSLGGNEKTIIGLFVAVGIVILLAIAFLTDILVKVTAFRTTGISADPEKYGLLGSPAAKSTSGTKAGLPAGDLLFELSKGFDIKIKGKPEKKILGEIKADTYAIKPTDFFGIRPIPKLLVAEGDEVLAGQSIFFDKDNERAMFTAPVSGEIVEIRRGGKRAITEVVILADKEIRYKDFGKKDPKALSREELVELMLESGTWLLMKQRPFNILANPDEQPKAIHIAGFDSSPMAPDYNFTLAEDLENIQKGIDALCKLTAGKVHLNLNAKQASNSIFRNLTGVQRNWFKGKHPAGVVGVQIHHIDPINKGDIVWTIGIQEVAILGRLFTEGRFNAEKTIAFGGPVAEKPGYYKTRLGANISNLISTGLSNDHVRIISGNVLTGKKVDSSGHLGFYDNQVSVIEEGDFYEFMGWLLPSYGRPSISRTFPWALVPSEEFNVNTNTHGEERAFVMTGQYESVLPMDLFPVHLLKAILYRDIDQMEGLGIYEVVEEDFALCEFVCTSKTDVQEILREGLDYVREQC